MASSVCCLVMASKLFGYSSLKKCRRAVVNVFGWCLWRTSLALCKKYFSSSVLSLLYFKLPSLIRCFVGMSVKVLHKTDFHEASLKHMNCWRFDATIRCLEFYTFFIKIWWFSSKSGDFSISYIKVLHIVKWWFFDKIGVFWGKKVWNSEK